MAAALSSPTSFRSQEGWAGEELRALKGTTLKAGAGASLCGYTEDSDRCSLATGLLARLTSSGKGLSGCSVRPREGVGEVWRRLWQRGEVTECQK